MKGIFVEEKPFDYSTRAYLGAEFPSCVPTGSPLASGYGRLRVDCETSSLKYAVSGESDNPQTW